MKACFVCGKKMGKGTVEEGYLYICKDCQPSYWEKTSAKPKKEEESFNPSKR